MSVSPEQEVRRARTFTRITVAAPSGQLDLSVPDDLPVLRIENAVAEQLGLSAGSYWALEHPVKGRLRGSETLASAGVRDGTVLHLRHDLAAAPSPAVDDVPAEVTALTDAAPVWSPDIARVVGAALLTAFVAVASLAALVVPALAGRGGSVSDPTGTALTCSVVVAVTGVVLLVAAAVAARRLRRNTVAGILAAGLVVPGAALGWSLLPGAGAGSTAGPAAGDAAWWWRLTLAALVGAVAAGLGWVLAPDTNPLGRTAGLALAGWAVLTAAAGIAHAAGASGVQAAGIVLLLAVASTAALTWVASHTSGLARAAEQASAGRGTRRDRLEDATGRARWDLAALGLGVSLPAAAAGAVLLAQPDAARDGQPFSMVALWAGVAGMTALTLRGRAYRHPVQVLAVAVPPVLTAAGVAVTGALLAATSATSETSATSQTLGGAASGSSAGVGSVLAVVLAVGAILGAFALVTGSDLAASRLRIALGRLETVCLIALAPLLLGVFGVFSAVASRLG